MITMTKNSTYIPPKSRKFEKNFENFRKKSKYYLLVNKSEKFN